MEHHGFPADETLAEFIDGRLDAEGRQRVIEHLAACPECYDTFLTATEFAAVSPEDAARPAGGGGEVVHGRFGRGAWYAAAAALAVLAVGLITYRDTVGRRYDEFAFGQRTGMAKLVEAARMAEHRPVAARFSGGFEYKKVKPTYRGPGDVPDDMLQLQIEALRLHEKAQTARAKEYGAAVGDVFMGKPAEGAKRLEQILLASTSKKELRDAIAASDDKRLLNDVAAAWIARSARSDDLREQDLEMALDAADRALQLDPRFAEAAYNRALALEYLDFYERAIEAWENYTKIETDPLWRKDAQDRVQDLKAAALPPPR